MASVINFIGSEPTDLRAKDSEHIDAEATSLSPNGSFRWDTVKPYSYNIQQLPPEDQLRGYVDQLIACSYYISFYGRNSNLLVDEYIDETVSNYKFMFLPKFKTSMGSTDAYEQVLDTMMDIIHHIEKGFLKKEINVEALDMFRSLKQFPPTPTVEKVDRPWIKPYLIWLSHYYTAHSTPMSCTSIRNFSVPSFRFSTADCNPCLNESNSSWNNLRDSTSGRLILNVRYHVMSSTFSALNYCVIAAVQKVPIYDYLARFNFAGCAIETIIGKIGEMCMSFDIARTGVTSSQKVAAIVRSHVLGLVNFSGCTAGIYTPYEVVNYGSSDPGCYRGYGLFEATRVFIDFLVKKYGATLEDKYLVARLFKGLAETKEQKESADYLAKQGGSASADELASYQKELGSLEALQFISQNNALLVAQSQETNPKAAAEGEDTENKESESKENESESKDTKSDNKGESESGDDSPDPDQPEETEEDDTSEDDEEETGEENDGEESGTGDASSDTSSSSSDVNDMPSEDEQPNTSDSRGFKFKVANPEAETTDSVMFREEMDHFLANILANPPEDLSPQNIQTLTSLHRYWLHTLSIGTIMGIVGSCIKHLPESLKQLTTQCTE